LAAIETASFADGAGNINLRSAQVSLNLTAILIAGPHTILPLAGIDGSNSLHPREPLEDRDYWRIDRVQ
jgi:hypothetical protein